MSPESQGIRRLIEDLSAAALKDLLQNVRHHSDMRRRIIAGDVSEREVNAAYLTYARRAGPEYRREVSDLTIRYYSDLMQLGNRYSEQFYAQLSNGHLADTVDDSDTGTESAGKRVPIELHGPPGSEVVATFNVENTDETETEVRFVPGDCTGPEGSPFIAPVSLEPSRSVIAPGERREVTIRLAMLPSLFVPGHLYRMPVRVVGDKEFVLELSIWAEDPIHVPPPAAEDVQPAPASKAQRKRGSTHAVLCPECGRTFERKEPSSRLYPHKTSAGAPCPAREGTPV